jgi:hypothetical protein
MDALSLNLISGLLGALVGAGISLYIYRRGQFEAARQKLLGLVYELGFGSQVNRHRSIDRSIGSIVSGVTRGVTGVTRGASLYF